MKCRSIHTEGEVYLQNNNSRALENPTKQCGKRGLNTEHGKIYPFPDLGYCRFSGRANVNPAIVNHEVNVVCPLIKLWTIDVK